MAEVLLNPDTSNNTNSSTASSSSSGHPNSTRSNKKRLNWLNWMRKSLDRSNRSKLCSCGFFHHNNGGHESSTNHSDWPVFTILINSVYLLKITNIDKNMFEGDTSAIYVHKLEINPIKEQSIINYNA